ncbi:RDD family protein [Rhodococcus sp. NPDC127528]|uniref:RDD family protein n=1 Tax=unclassified Rhodococcus (in: high G+C Gram-positive bacteria) TaxID=192944 RepID=UPI00363029D2
MTHPHLEPERRPAGIVTRGIGAAIDLGVVLALLGGSYLGLTFVRLLFSPQNFGFPEPGALWSVTAWIVTSVVYLTVCWATTGRTIGSQAMGLRVTTTRGRRVRWSVAALRALFCVFFAIGLAWAAVDRRRRSVQDILLRTEVVYDWRPDPDAIT